MLIHYSHLLGPHNITQWKTKAEKSCSQEVISNDWQVLLTQEQWHIKLMFPFFTSILLSAIVFSVFSTIQFNTRRNMSMFSCCYILCVSTSYIISTHCHNSNCTLSVSRQCVNHEYFCHLLGFCFCHVEF